MYDDTNNKRKEDIVTIVDIIAFIINSSTATASSSFPLCPHILDFQNLSRNWRLGREENPKTVVSNSPLGRRVEKMGTY